MWTYNNICINTNLMYKDPKGGYSASYVRLQRATERRGVIKIKAKARTCSMHLKRYLVKGDLGRLWNTD